MKKINNIIWKVKYEKNKNWLKAVDLLKDGLKEYPDNYDLHFELAEIYAKNNFIVEAIEEYQYLLSKNQQDSTILFRIANLYLSIEEYEIAIHYFDLIEEYFPEIYYNKAISLNRLGKINESIALLEDLLQRTPEFEVGYFFLIEQYLAKKQYVLAIKKIDFVEKKFGKQGQIFYLRGLSYYYLNWWLQAFVEFGKAKKMHFSSKTFLRIYGLSADKIGKTDLCIKLLKENIELDPSNSYNYIDLINILMKHKHFEEAFKIADKAKKNIGKNQTVSLLFNKITSEFNKEED